MPRLSIKTKLSAIISSLVLAFGLFNLAFFPAVARRQFHAQAVSAMAQVASAAAVAAGPALDTGDRNEIARVFKGLQGMPTLSWYVLLDGTGRPVASTPTFPPWATGLRPVAAKAPGASMREPEGLLIATAPVEVRHGPAGLLVLGFTTAEIEGGVAATARITLWVGGAAFLAAITLVLLLSERYIRPLERLTQAVKQVASGNLQGLEMGVHSQDELGILSRSFEAMTHTLRVSRDEIELQNKLLESRVHERTGQLLETIWELEEIRANLEKLVQERTRGLEQSRAELKAWAGTLEDKVQAKTQELTEANDNLLMSLHKLQELDRIKSEFLANMSHELRTPLNAVIGFSGLLMQEREGRVAPEVKTDLSIIHQNGRNLLGMIDSILDLSKIEAGRFELDLAPMDPFPVLDQVAALAAGLIGNRPIRFTLDPGQREGSILGDELRFKQIITNLVGNAIKFTEQGAVDMRAERDGNTLRIAIRDTGIGMTDMELQRLFRPFQQVDGSITRRFGGTGLGLALSQRLAIAMGGRITVASDKGRGSVFTFELPLLSEVAS